MEYSWSKSGRLLASGSDDQHLNIHSYQPDSSVAPFSLTTTVATGHQANIFSVKFMPHSNDQTLVTCAGDAEVRVFDIEYSGQSSISSTAANLASSGLRGENGRQFRNFHNGVRYLSDGNTNVRVYRSHGDRAKRIVTESSPYLFLSCSEDGEVRQWDLRMPSSAYPPPRGGRHRARDDSNVPPPLISYKRYHLDLNTISCSASQPHYIALGGAHLHCFLHDRRMLGRDVASEWGKLGSASPANGLSEYDDELMGKATRCVRRFAPRGQKKMRRTDNGHITACKISDANPNEMIASWSGDHIYSFDLVRSSDARDTERGTLGVKKGSGRSRVKESGDRKRKRKKEHSSVSREGQRRGSSQLQRSLENIHEGDLALRVHYENGQSEDISVDTPMVDTPQSPLMQFPELSNVELQQPSAQGAREIMLSESERRSLSIANSVVKIRKLMFSLDALSPGTNSPIPLDSSSHHSTFAGTFKHAARRLPQMDSMMRSWRYPVNPSEDQIIVQQTLRDSRDSSRRFVQAAGTLARVLGGDTMALSRHETVDSSLFEEIVSVPLEGSLRDSGQIFSYDFLKAILLWLERGPHALLHGFKESASQRRNSTRHPVPEDAHMTGIDEYLIPYLLRLSRDRPIVNVDASRFERDETRHIFQSETAAVVAFSHAIKIPFANLSKAVTPASPSSHSTKSPPSGEDRQTALRFWAFKVGRGLLMNAGEGVNFAFVDRAFGGSGVSRTVDEGRSQEDVNPNQNDIISESVGWLRVFEGGDVEMVHGGIEGAGPEASDRFVMTDYAPASESRNQSESICGESISTSSDEEVMLMDDLHNELADHMGGEFHVTDDDEGNEENDDNDSDGDGDEDITAEERQFVWQTASDRGRLRESVEAHVPCSAHTRAYRGHSNVKTVKDVNFFGLQDEYVVSGSDSGHLFIWDKKTSQLVNILEGDGEVVNVVQGERLDLYCFQTIY